MYNKLSFKGALLHIVIFTDDFYGPGRAMVQYVCLYVDVCVWTVTFE